MKRHEFEDLSGPILGAAVEVHKHLGPGYKEDIYEEALCFEFEIRNIPFERQRAVRVYYKEREIGRHRIDVVVGEEIVVELEAVAEISPDHLAQTVSYLKSSGCRVGRVLNFSKARLQTKRVVL